MKGEMIKVISSTLSYIGNNVCWSGSL